MSQTISHNLWLGIYCSNTRMMQPSLDLVDILDIDLQDVDVGPEEVGGGEVEELLVEDDVDAPAVPDVHHQAAVRDPLGQVVSKPSQAELTAQSRELYQLYQSYIVLNVIYYVLTSS